MVLLLCRERMPANNIVVDTITICSKETMQRINYVNLLNYDYLYKLI